MKMQFISLLLVIVSFIMINSQPAVEPGQQCFYNLDCMGDAENMYWCNNGGCEENTCEGTPDFCSTGILGGCEDDNCRCVPVTFNGDPDNTDNICVPDENNENEDDIFVTECLPNGCFYDFEYDLTKKIECRADRGLLIRYFIGDNGCNDNQHFLPKLTYNSQRNNPCCTGDSSVEGTETAQYSISINNQYSDEVFSVFQVQPLTAEEGDGNYSIIFQKFSVANDATGSISWPLNWGLSYAYGESGECLPLTEGVVYTLVGDVITATPGTFNNAAQLSYDATINPPVWRMVPSDMNLNNNQIGITTFSFDETTAISQCLTVSVTIDGSPVFVMNGEPNKEYKFTLTPTYYITTEKTEIGTTVSADVIGKSQIINFAEGNNFKCDYSNSGEFIECIYS